MAKELDADMVDDSMVRAAAKMALKPAVDHGAEELFEKKLSKEEKKELAAQKKAEREARKAATATEDPAAPAPAAGDGDAPTTKAVPAKAKVWCGVVRFTLAGLGSARHGTAPRRSALRCGAVYCGAVWCGLVQSGEIG